MIGAAILLCLHLFFFEIYCYDLFSRRTIFDNLEKTLNMNPVLLSAHVQEKWFTQRLDHSNVYDNRTWQQRYFINSQYFTSSNGPIFIMFGAESAGSPVWLIGGTWVQYAARFKAMLVYLEHRFYGESHPLPDITTESLRYLSSSQALSDVAYFVGAMKKNHTNNKWIAFGGSYAGNLVAWYRLKFPHLVQGVVSSSSPVLAQVDFREFYQVVAQSLSTHSEDCVSEISDAYVEIGVLLETEDGKRNLTEMFNVCSPLENSTDYKDIILFQQGLSDSFAWAVQTNELDPKNNHSIKSLCNIMVDTQLGAPINRLAAVNQFSLNHFKFKCMDYSYKDLIRSLQGTQWNSPNANGRQWFYQTCSEFGYYATSSAEPHVFGNSFPVDFYTQLCTDVFGKSFDGKFINKMTNRTNLVFGGLKIAETVNNIVFVHGSLDAWNALGITRTKNIQSPAVFIQGATHCEDMIYRGSISNSPQMTAAIITIEKYINYWLNMKI